MHRSLKTVLIISSYIIVAMSFFIIGGHYYDDILNVINKESSNQIDIIGKQYSLTSNGHTKFFPSVKKGERIMFEFLDNSNIDFLVDNNGKIIKRCSISYYKSDKNKYYYSFTGCQTGYISGDSDNLMISINDGYFCVMSDDCLESEKFILIN